MLDIVLLIFFGVMAYRIALAVRRTRPIFMEYARSQSLGNTVLLFPVGPIAMLFLVGRSPLLAFLAAMGCFLPGLLLARRAGAAFDRAGTDRVDEANAAATQAFGTALVGLIYAAGVFLYIAIIAVYFNADS